MALVGQRLFYCQNMQGGVVMVKLTIKQEAFCLEYAASGNATDAYKKAGYKAKNDKIAGVESHKLLKNPKIKLRLQELAEEIATPKIADIKEVQEFLTSVMRRETREEEIVVAADIAEIKEKKTPISSAIKAAETLAKIQGAFRTDINITGSLPVIISGEDEIED